MFNSCPGPPFELTDTRARLQCVRVEKKRRELGLPCLNQLTHGDKHLFKGVTMTLTLPWKKTASAGFLLECDNFSPLEVRVHRGMSRSLPGVYTLSL